MSSARNDEPADAQPAELAGSEVVRDESVEAEDAGTDPGNSKPQRPRKRKPQPTFDDGATTRVFKFPSRTYPRSAYYVTGDEIIVRIKKGREKWKLVFPKKRIVTYRTNRWFHKPRWVEIELTYTQAVRHGLVAPTAAPPPPEKSPTTAEPVIATDVESVVPEKEVDATKHPELASAATAGVTAEPVHADAASESPATAEPHPVPSGKVHVPGGPRPTDAPPLIRLPFPELTAAPAQSVVEMPTPEPAAIASPSTADTSVAPQKLEADELEAEPDFEEELEDDDYGDQPEPDDDEASEDMQPVAASPHPDASIAASAPVVETAQSVTDTVPASIVEGLAATTAAAESPSIPEVTAEIQPTLLQATATPSLEPIIPAGDPIQPPLPDVPGPVTATSAPAEKAEPAKSAVTEATLAAVPVIAAAAASTIGLGSAQAPKAKLETTASERERADAFYASRAQRKAATSSDHIDWHSSREPREIRPVWLWGPVLAMVLLTTGVIWSQWSSDDTFEVTRTRAPATDNMEPALPASRGAAIVTAGIEPPERASTTAGAADAAASLTQSPAEPARERTAAAASPAPPAKDTTSPPPAAPAASANPVAPPVAREPRVERPPAKDNRQWEAQERERAEAEVRARRQAETATARRAAELATNASVDPIPIPGQAPTVPSRSVPIPCRDVLASAAGTVSIQFEFASATLRQASIDALHRLATSLIACPMARLKIEGHTDSDGDVARNQSLSERRAGAVRQTLISAGSSADQLTAVGLGQTRPIVANDSAENKRRNRRIDLKVE